MPTCYYQLKAPSGEYYFSSNLIMVFGCGYKIIAGWKIKEEKEVVYFNANKLTDDQILPPPQKFFLNGVEIIKQTT